MLSPIYFALKIFLFFCKKTLALYIKMCYDTKVRYAYRYALMREVADLESGNFRGVCPISNRAKIT